MTEPTGRLKEYIQSLEQAVMKKDAEIERLKSELRRQDLQKTIQEQAQEITALRRKSFLLKQDSITDNLTGALNRKGIEQRVKNALNHAGRRQSDTDQTQNSSCGVFALFDLDKFKPINDTYGHPAGDACLQLVAKTIHNMIRETDAVARLGGDEFVLFLSGDDVENELKKAHAIQNKLNTLSLDWDGHQIKIGASMGCAAFTDQVSYQTLYDVADRALYTNKAQRHNTPPRRQAPTPQP